MVLKIVGNYMITYDGDATEPFEKEISRPYGLYVAEHVVRPVLGGVRAASRDPKASPRKRSPSSTGNAN